MIGITAYGAYIPRLRLERSAITQANEWYAPGLLSKGKGSRAMANWDEDSITMAVAAARDCLDTGDDRSHISAAYLASTTFPFADRSNAGVMSAGLTLPEATSAVDIGGSQRAALSALGQALDTVKARSGDVLVAAADNRKALAGSTQELGYGDGAAALILGDNEVLAEFLGSAVVTDDFVDHFRESGSNTDYYWEERWIRNEGYGKLIPKVVSAALEKACLNAYDIDHFICPTLYARQDTQIARLCDVSADKLVDSLASQVGNTGVGHGLLMVAKALETAESGDIILLTQFGQGAEAFLFRVTDSIREYCPRRGVCGWLARGHRETNYTRFLAYSGQLPIEKGMRGEQDKKTALSTYYRHKDMLAGFIAGRCRKTGEIHFPPSRLSYTPGNPELDSQEPYKMADRTATVMSWSADYLSFSMSPPSHYGLLNFDGGGRLGMEFTDVEKGEVETGMSMDMVFRVKDLDLQRGFRRYFWKATPSGNSDSKTNSPDPQT